MELRKLNIFTLTKMEFLIAWITPIFILLFLTRFMESSWRPPLVMVFLPIFNIMAIIICAGIIICGAIVKLFPKIADLDFVEEFSKWYYR